MSTCQPEEDGEDAGDSAMGGVLQNWPEIVRVLWSLRVWERRELARITLWSVARYKWSQKKISKMRDAEIKKIRDAEI